MRVFLGLRASHSPFGLAVAAALSIFIIGATPAGSASAEPPLRRIGTIRLPLMGVAATVDAVAPVVPKNVASAVRIAVTAGGQSLSGPELAAFLGGAFRI